MLLWHFLDWFFVLFHSAVILFIVFGWIFKPTRRLNLVVIAITAFSWFVIGIFRGLGYCFLTDWHWQVLYELGTFPHETSYIQYLFRRIINVRVSSQFADNLTAIVFFVSLIMSVIFNLKSVISARKHKNKL